MTSDPLQSVLDAVRAELGDPATWGAPVEMRDSLALCALNSAHSLRANSTSVRNLLRRYRAHRAAAGADPEKDSGPDLVAAMDAAGGPESFALAVLQNRTPLPGTRQARSVGIYEALMNLHDLGITTAAQLRERHEERDVRRAWVRVKGLGPQSWDYLCMNAGVGSLTKPDVMVRRFLTRAVGETVRSARATQLVTDAARELGVEVRALDRAIWLHMSPTGTENTEKVPS
ncbi:hypothetical protein DEO23_12235 [Brachybacterium endophyticum]|uniref:Uncharacterized protein n=1 Tax=Brachybacterium endophyticum TaxID=2182385 RepID=A0A2U2RHM9_9MICO|nr:hypothetical protein [Brachybacterium endophyticum]PWH05354.1 hypothetical protein DEO23_12235 [Brachybacterium endophyticum]